MRMLSDARQRGLMPTAALDELIRIGCDHPTAPRSHVILGSRDRAVSLAALKEIAARL